MIKRIILVTRSDDFTPEAFRKHYAEIHAPIVAKMPGLRRYIQNPVASDSDISGIAEVWYDTEADFLAAMHSPEAAAANASLAQFVDVAKTRVLSVEETMVI